jgi:hypothetical protein
MEDHRRDTQLYLREPIAGHDGAAVASARSRRHHGQWFVARAPATTAYRHLTAAHWLRTEVEEHFCGKVRVAGEGEGVDRLVGWQDMADDGVDFHFPISQESDGRLQLCVHPQRPHHRQLTSHDECCFDRLLSGRWDAHLYDSAPAPRRSKRSAKTRRSTRTLKDNVALQLVAAIGQLVGCDRSIDTDAGADLERVAIEVNDGGPVCPPVARDGGNEQSNRAGTDHDDICAVHPWSDEGSATYGVPGDARWLGQSRPPKGQPIRDRYETTRCNRQKVGEPAVGVRSLGCAPEIPSLRAQAALAAEAPTTTPAARRRVNGNGLPLARATAVGGRSGYRADNLVAEDHGVAQDEQAHGAVACIVKVRSTDPPVTDLDQGFMVSGFRGTYLLQPEVAWAVDT